MAGQDCQLRAGPRVPDAGGLIQRGADDTPAVRRICCVLDTAGMAGKYCDLRARLRIPDARGLIVRSGDDACAIGRVGGRKELAVMAQ